MLAPSVEAAASEVAALALCRESFAYFLTWCRIRSDDPYAPGVIPLRPWPFQVSRAEAWESGASEVILKERQMGFSAVLVAPYMLWRAMYRGWACGYLSVGQDEAREEIGRVRALYAELPEFLRAPGVIRVDDATFEGGGRIIAFPSTEHAGISYTLQLVVMDEAAFHPYGQANYAAIQPAAARGQFLILSTADPTIGPSGFFHDMYWSSKRGETPYRAVFTARCRPDRDEAWYERARMAYRGLAEEFDAYYPESDAAAFVGRSGLVYAQFMAETHVKPDPCKWEECKRRVAGVDFGGGDPTAALPLGMTAREHVHQYGEAYWRGPVTVEDIANCLMPWHRRAPFSRVLCDPSEPVAIESLRRLGLPAEPADNRRGEGLGQVAFLLDNNRLTINPQCTDSIEEFRGYRWRDRVDPHSKERYATTTPVDHHADAMDARRYAVMELLAMLATGPVIGRTLAGRRRARYAA